MVLDVRDVRERVDEAHRPPEVGKLELAANGLAVLHEPPVRVQQRHHPARLLHIERSDPAFAGHALAFLQRFHQASRRAKRRATYRSTSSWNSSAMRSPFNVTVFSPSSYTGATGRSPVPGRLMPMFACLLSPGPLTTQPMTATVMFSAPTNSWRQAGMRTRTCSGMLCASSWK